MAFSLRSIAARSGLAGTAAGGALVVLAVVAAIELARRTGLIPIPTPAALTLLAVAYTGYSGGLQAGLAGAAVAVAHGVFFFSEPGRLLHFSDANFSRVAMLAFAAPFVAWMTGALKERNEKVLRQKIESDRIHVQSLEGAERRLRAKEAQLRSLIDALPAYIAYVDRDLRVRFHNKPYEEWTGLPGSFIDGHTVQEVVGDALYESGTKRHALAALEGRRGVFERVQMIKGKRTVVEAHFIPDVTEEGTVAGYFGMLIDVTSHKEALSDVALLGERLRRALAGSRLALWELDLQSGIVKLGREWAAIVGGRDAMVEMPLAELRKLVHPEDRQRVDEGFQTLMEGRAEQYDTEHRVLAANGEWKWVQSSGRAVEFGVDGRPTRLSGTNRDITPRKRAEMAVRESERKLRLITDAVPAMIAYLDADLRYRFCNRPYCHLVGRREAEILGSTVREIVGEDQYEVARPWLEKGLAGERTEHERRYRLADGTMADLSVTYVPHIADDFAVIGMYALLVDLTERKRAERVKERFISMVSHELRSPLTSIIWTLDELSEGGAGRMSPAEAASVALAQQNAERMLHLADEILDLESLDQGAMRMPPANVALGDLIGRAVGLSRPLAAKRGVRLEAGALPAAEVRADPDRLVQVLVNLVSNAAKHSPEGGRIAISIEPRDSRYRVCVADNGAGVPERFREHLFERFSQSKEGKALGGSGLGLAICSEIVERSGGAIGYEPNPQGGSIFWFELPALPQGPRAAPES